MEYYKSVKNQNKLINDIKQYIKYNYNLELNPQFNKILLDIMDNIYNNSDESYENNFK